MQLERITKHTKPAERNPRWQVVDADGERLGRFASKIAAVLQGKHKPDYSRHQLAGDVVVVVNASKIGVSGNKRTQKVYYRHTGYVGHLRSRTFDEMLDRFPARVIELAVKGMLPRNRLGRQMLRRLKVYPGPDHPHEAQVNAGQGKPKQEPAAPTTRTPRRRAGAAAAQTPQAEVAVVEAPEEAEVATAVEAPAEASPKPAPRRRAPRPKSEAAGKAAPAATRRRARKPSTATAKEPPTAADEPAAENEEKA